jgi:hypothetical protein
MNSLNDIETEVNQRAAAKDMIYGVKSNKHDIMEKVRLVV